MLKLDYDFLVNDIKDFAKEANTMNTEYYYSLKAITVSQVKKVIYEYVAQDYPVKIEYIENDTLALVEKPAAKSRVKKLVYEYNSDTIFPSLIAYICI